MTEDQLEQETLSWLTDVGYTHAYGPDIAPDRTIGVRLQLNLIRRHFSSAKYSNSPINTGVSSY